MPGRIGEEKREEGQERGDPETDAPPPHPLAGALPALLRPQQRRRRVHGGGEDEGRRLLEGGTWSARRRRGEAEVSEATEEEGEGLAEEWRGECG
ncbi:hypothetical protein BHM03_00008703 [Ensete ventricosum]|nr:hypothetical protein BHM03_00008703 [Ensete ventricosum]